MFVDLDRRPEVGHTVDVEWRRDTGTQIAAAISPTASLLVCEVLGENVGVAFRHPFRYAR